MKKAVIAAATIIACCLSLPSNALDFGKFIQLFTLGSHAAIHLNGGTSLTDHFSNNMRVDGNKLFISYWFNNVSAGGESWLLADPDPSNPSGNQEILIDFIHTPGARWHAETWVGCVPDLRNSQCDQSLSNWANLYFDGPILPNDAPCDCWHHIMVSIDTSTRSGTYALDGGVGTLSSGIAASGALFVGPGGIIPYTVANKWVLGYLYRGDLAEFYLNTIQLFDPATDQGKFRYTDSNNAKGLGDASTHAACEIPGSTPEICLRGDVAFFLTQENVQTDPPIHVFTANGNPIEQARSDPCAFPFVTGCQSRQ